LPPAYLPGDEEEEVRMEIVLQMNTYGFSLVQFNKLNRQFLSLFFHLREKPRVSVWSTVSILKKRDLDCNSSSSKPARSKRAATWHLLEGGSDQQILLVECPANSAMLLAGFSMVLKKRGNTNKK
jgi:hypothetical protein